LSIKCAKRKRISREQKADIQSCEAVHNGVGLILEWGRTGEAEGPRGGWGSWEGDSQPLSPSPPTYRGFAGAL